MLTIKRHLGSARWRRRVVTACAINGTLLALAATSLPGAALAVPSGEMLVFRDRADYIGSLFAIAPDGSGLTRLTWPPPGATLDVNGKPSISPDGTRIVFGNLGPLSTQGGDIYVMGSDGSMRMNLTADRPGVQIEGVFSPDGARIVYAQQRATVQEPDLIVAMGADGSSPTTLVSGDGLRSPQFSPNGTEIVYQALGDIFVMDADGSNPVNLTNTPDEIEDEPEFSPDGTRIVFARHPRSALHQDLYIMDRDGSHVTSVTQTTDMEEFDATFSPQGDRLAVSQVQDDGTQPGFGPPRTAEIVLMDLNGTDRRTLTLGLQPDWGFLNPPLPPGSCADSPLTVLGTDAAEALPGTATSDSISGQSGDDVLAGGAGPDALCGGSGADHLVGEDDGAEIESTDTAAGRDVLRGGEGKDLLVGGPGPDVLVGGPGKDRCVGGPGRDRKKSC